MNYLGGFCLPGSGQWPTCPKEVGMAAGGVIPAPETPFAGISEIPGAAEEFPEGNHSLVQRLLTPGVPQSHQNAQSS